MKISYTLTEEDQKKYIVTNFDTKKLSLRKIIMMLVIVVFSFLGLMFFIASEYVLGLFMLAVVSLYLYVLIGLPKKTKKKYLNKLMDTGILGETKIVEVNEEELKFISPSRTTIHDYSDLSNISIIQNNFILIDFKHADSLTIPTSAFQNSEEMINFINLIKSNAKIL